MPENGSDAGPSLAPDAFQSWLAELPLTKAVESARALADQVARVRSGEPGVRKRVRLLDLLAASADRLLPLVEDKLGRAALPLSHPNCALYNEGDRLLKEMAASYAEVAFSISERWLGLGNARQLQNATLRGVQAHTRQLQLAHLVYGKVTPNTWFSLHRLYRVAREGSFAQLQLENASESIERLYLKALLMAFADPARLAAGELDRVRFYIERYGELGRILDAAEGYTGKAAEGGLFLIQADSDVPGRSLAKWHDARPGARDLVLDCSKLVVQVGTHIKGLEANLVPARLGLPVVARHPQYLAMLRTLRRGWGAPPTRRHPRSRFHPRVDLVAGFDPLWQFLSGPAYRRRQDEQTGVGSPPDEMSEWAILDESPVGFALQFVAGTDMEVRVGELVAVRPHERGSVLMCIARRASSSRGKKLTLGIEVLAPKPVAITVPLTNAQTGGTEAKPGGMRQVRAVLLLKVPTRDNAPALIAAAETLWPGIEFTVVNRGKSTRLRIARRLEKTATSELFILERGI